MIEQIRFLIRDYSRICGRKKGRFLYIWMSRPAVGVFLYRVERGMYLMIGTAWTLLRIFFTPVLNIMYAYSNCEINYHASIGPGILVLHSSPGTVISGKSVIGKNLTLVGGNIIGARPRTLQGSLIIGDNCSLGANAVVLGPVTLGNNVQVGACALVIHNFGDDCAVVGNPAKILTKSKSSYE